MWRIDTIKALELRINELCERQGITLNALSNHAGIPPTTVYSMFNGKSQNPGIVTLKKLCDGFREPLSLADFFCSDLFRNLEQEIR